MSHRRTMPYSAPPYALLHRPEDPQVLTLAVPGYRQARNYSCGFAAALMVLRHFERPLRGQELFHSLGTARDGTAQGAIVRVLRSQSLRANLRYDMNFARIAECLASSKLLIGYLHDEEHWLVLYGFGRTPDRVFVADPEPEKGCEHLWDGYGARLNGFAIVCSPAREAPPTQRREEPQQLSFDFAPGASVKSAAGVESSP